MDKRRKKLGPLLPALGLLALAALFPAIAGAWGLSTELNESWAAARIVFPVLKNKAVKYCIRNDEPARYENDSLAFQVETALKIWLAPLASLGLDKARITQVDCAGSDYNLQIYMGKEKEWTNLGSYQLSTVEGAHSYSLVKFDTGFLFRDGEKTYPILDFKAYSGGFQGEPALIRSLSFQNPSTVSAFAGRAKVDYLSVFWSTFPSLIHELGHSFGLCDTYEAAIKDQCDPKYSSPGPQPSSVMKDTNYFYLTDDDKQGIRHLFDRYK